MANPVVLSIAGSTTFPTWAGGGTTTLWVRNKENKEGQVSVNAGNGHEYVNVSPNDTTSIQRQWGGIIIGVTNSGQTAVEVWTA
jgi:hypothetical protein